MLEHINAQTSANTKLGVNIHPCMLSLEQSLEHIRSPEGLRCASQFFISLQSQTLPQLLAKQTSYLLQTFNSYLHLLKRASQVYQIAYFSIQSCIKTWLARVRAWVPCPALPSRKDSAEFMFLSRARSAPLTSAEFNFMDRLSSI